MKAKSKQSGVTLMEMAVVIAVMALLTVFGLPAIRAFFNSLATTGNTKAMIGTALSCARAIAAKQQRYAGVRFQKAFNPDDPLNPLKADQYMIFIVHEEPRKMGNLTIGFRAVEGLEPIKLPENIGVMDLRVRTNHGTSAQAAASTADEPIIAGYLSDPVHITDTSSFSIVFSPTGKMVIHNVRVRNRDGWYRPNNGGSKVSMDDLFNSRENITIYNTGIFIQDDYAHLGLGAEFSRRSFVIYDESVFEKMDNTGRYDYLLSLEVISINPYTGTIIKR